MCETIKLFGGRLETAVTLKVTESRVRLVMRLSDLQ